MKISKFNQSKIKKTLFFEDEEVNFYFLDRELIERINEEIIKPNKNISDEEFMYKLIPLICDIELDMSFEEFTELLKTTNENVLRFIEAVMEILDDTFSMMESANNIEEHANNIAKNNLFENVKTDEEKLDELLRDLELATSTKDKMAILKEISVLEEKMGIND